MPETKKRRGSRGCPNCGSHNTEGAKAQGIYWCVTCRHRWEPCTPFCRGYKLIMSPAPHIQGCQLCGVPDRVAAYWPEAYRAMAMELDGLKKSQLPQPGDGESKHRRP